MEIKTESYCVHSKRKITADCDDDDTSACCTAIPVAR